MNKEPDVVVIGAGAAGLAATYELKKTGLSVRLLEKSHEIAGPWRRRHPQLHLNTHRKLSALPGMRLPKGGDFPSRDELIAYLEAYAREMKLPVEFGVEVTSVARAGRSWRLETSVGEIVARHVVVATGRETVPFVPRWPGMDSFPRRLLHAADFGNVQQYAGKRVLVAGAGNSGSDVLNQLSRVATSDVWISIRHGSVTVPAYLFGFPMQRMSPLMETLPIRAIDWMLKDTQQRAFGDLSKFGFPKDIAGGASRMASEGVSPAIDTGFVAAVKAGRMTIVSEIDRFEGRDIVLSDKRRVTPDVVIAATGYRTGLEPLLGHLGVLDDKGVPLANGPQRVEQAPGLWFMGMRPSISGFLRAANMHSCEIARAIHADLFFDMHKRPVRADGFVPVATGGTQG